MEFLQPSTWTEALEMKSAHPEAMPIAGGTDVMVEINLDRHRPASIIDLTRVAALAEWGMDEGSRRDLCPDHRRAGRSAAWPGDGVPHSGLSPDQKPRHRWRQPRLRVTCR